MIDPAVRIAPPAMLWLILLTVSPAALAIDPDTCSHTAVPSTTPSSDFTDLGGGIVRHEATSLEWQRCALGQNWDGSTCQGTAGTYTWQQALQAAEAQSGWRLPNIHELRSIVEYCRINPAINRQVFPSTPASHFWSASPDAGYSDYAWNVYFSSGYDYWYYKSYDYRVRLVRGGQ